MKDGWTILTLRALMREMNRRYEQRFQAQEAAVKAALIVQEKMVTLALASANTAVTKAETAAEKRFDAVNEFRGLVEDQAATFYPRAEAEMRFSALNSRLEQKAQFNMSSAISVFAAAVSAILLLITIFRG